MNDTPIIRPGAFPGSPAPAMTAEDWATTLGGVLVTLVDAPDPAVYRRRVREIVAEYRAWKAAA